MYKRQRQAASCQRRPTSANVGVAEIGYFSRAFCPRGPSKIDASMGRFTPKKLLGGTWAKRALSASLLGGTLASRNYAYNLMPSCSRQLRTNPWFSLRQFSSLGTPECRAVSGRFRDGFGCPRTKIAPRKTQDLCAIVENSWASDCKHNCDLQAYYRGGLHSRPALPTYRRGAFSE